MRVTQFIVFKLSTGAVAVVVVLLGNHYHSKWVKLRDISCSFNVTVRVRVALKRTIVSD